MIYTARNWRNKKEREIELPLEEAMRIQEALKPLGYAIHGFRDWVSGEGLVLYLGSNQPLLPYTPPIKEESIPRTLSMDEISESFKV